MTFRSLLFYPPPHYVSSLYPHPHSSLPYSHPGGLPFAKPAVLSHTLLHLGTFPLPSLPPGRLAWVLQEEVQVEVCV